MSLRKTFLAGLLSLLTVAFGFTSTANAVFPAPIKPFPKSQPYHHHDHHTHYQPVYYQPTSNDGTGLTLGVYVVENGYGSQLVGLMPNTSAQFAGLRTGDILIEMFHNGNYFPTNTLHNLRTAKSLIGPNQLTYVRVFRPGVGEFYPTVTFQLDGYSGGPAVAFSKNGVVQNGFAQQGPVQAMSKAAPAAKWGGETEMSKKVFKNRPELKIKPDFKSLQTLKIDPKLFDKKN